MLCSDTVRGGRSPEGAMAPASLSSGFQSFTPIPTIKLGPSGAGSRVGGSPVRLRVSPAAAPTPTGAFNQRSEALFPRAGALGYVVCFAPRHLSSLSVHECGAAGSASGQTACPVHPTLCQSPSHHDHASPLHPGSPSPPLVPVWMNVYFLFPWCRTSLPFDFLSVLVV